MDCKVHGVAKRWTRLSSFHFHSLGTSDDKRVELSHGSTCCWSVLQSEPHPYRCAQGSFQLSGHCSITQLFTHIENKLRVTTKKGGWMS